MENNNKFCRLDYLPDLYPRKTMILVTTTIVASLLVGMAFCGRDQNHSM